MFFYDDGVNTRKMQFQLSGITSGNTRVLTIPDASTTLVGTDNSQTLSNKTLIDPTNNIMASSIKNSSGTQISISGTPTSNHVLTASNGTTASWTTLSTTSANGLSSATTTVVVNTSAAPSTGQVLTALNSTSASWQSQNVIAQIQKNTDLISTNLANNKNVIAYTIPSQNVMIVLTTTAIYKINYFSSGGYSLVYNGVPYPTNYFINILYVGTTLYALCNNMDTYTSTNYTTWTKISNNITSFFSGITSSSNYWDCTSYIINDGTYFYMSGYNTSSGNSNMYHIIKSSDCMTWSTISNSDSYWFNFGMYYIPSLTGAKYFNLRCGPDGDFECYLDQSVDGVTFAKVKHFEYLF